MEENEHMLGRKTRKLRTIKLLGFTSIMLRKAELILPSLSAIALFPCYFSFLGLQGYLSNSDNTNREEYLYLIGLSVVQGAFFLVLFVVAAIFMRKKVRPPLFVLYCTPYAFIAFSGLFAQTKGIPW